MLLTMVRICAEIVLQVYKCVVRVSPSFKYLGMSPIIMCIIEFSPEYYSVLRLEITSMFLLEIGMEFQFYEQYWNPVELLA